MSSYRVGFVPSNGHLSSILSGANTETSNRMGAPFTTNMGYGSVSHVTASHGNKAEEHSEELWQACAGPLVYVPQVRDKVWYFPQGHMEQVTALNLQGCSEPLPHSDIDSKILCCVVTRNLSAETDTDEVFAQVSLLPICSQFTQDEKSHEETPQEPALTTPKSSVRLFTKILTASDTSTHGGFSVLRKHAEDCLPPLDMTQDPPTQDLVAKDLHGKEWPFKHTYRGHPRRHLLTTGWSVFVSHKRLTAGDAVIFLRGENGQLRVGIRRAKWQPAVQQAVMSNQSMHMGVIATAKHAITTRTIFVVFYKPRVSLSAFLVPVDKFTRANLVPLSVGMRFKMRFETEDASDRSYAGTITGIEDLDPLNFPGSTWRSLKVNWDEVVNSERPDRVSPWEIELSVATPIVNPPPPLRTKRVRPSPANASTMPDLSALGAGSGALECTYAPRLSRVSQGQEPWNAGISSLWRSSPHGLSSMQEAHYPQHHISLPSQPGSLQVGQTLPLPSPRASFYRPFFSGPETDLKFSGASPSVHAGISHSLLQGSAWPTTTSSDSAAKWLMSFLPQHDSSPGTQMRQEKSLVTGNIPVPPSQQQQHKQQQQQQQQHHPLLFPNFSPFSPWEAQKQEVLAPPTPVAVESGCKLFGISLKDIPTGAKLNKPKMPAALDHEEGVKGVQVNATHILPHPHGSEGDAQKHIKSDASSEQERMDHNAPDARFSQSIRSRTKVIKRGSMVGRGIDLSRFDSYENLLMELEVMFNMEGELTDPAKGWQVAYNDSEGDTMKVGDDPWLEFCTMVKKLYILSPEEVEQGGNRTTLVKEISQGQVHVPQR